MVIGLEKLDLRSPTSDLCFIHIGYELNVLQKNIGIANGLVKVLTTTVSLPIIDIGIHYILIALGNFISRLGIVLMQPDLISGHQGRVVDDVTVFGHITVYAEKEPFGIHPTGKCIFYGCNVIGNNVQIALFTSGQY